MFKKMISFAAVAGLVLALAGSAPAALVTSANLGTTLNPIYAFTSSDGTTATGTWAAPAGITDFKVLVVGGGGGGGRHRGGGGGAGDLIFDDTFVVVGGDDYSVVIGAGGIGARSGFNDRPTSGSQSEFESLIAAGGGNGSGRQSGDGTIAASSGGSGGGGAPGNTVGAAGVGFNAFSGGNYDGTAGGGGGGAGGSGGSSGGPGGIGLYFGDEFFDSVIGDLDATLGDLGYFAGGGGGASAAAGDGGDGGLGGGGNGGSKNWPSLGNPPAEDGLANTGGGGGGGHGTDNANGPESYGGDGGPGVVVVSYTIPEPATMALLAFGGLGVLLKRRRRA